MSGRSFTRFVSVLCALQFAAGFNQAMAANSIVNNALLLNVSVNGGADTANPGTTCFRIDLSAPAACASGVIAIQNNNKQLLAGVLLAKSTGVRVHLYIETASSSQHCPWQVFTTCTLTNIEIP